MQKITDYFRNCQLKTKLELKLIGLELFGEGRIHYRMSKPYENADVFSRKRNGEIGKQ